MLRSPTIIVTARRLWPVLREQRHLVVAGLLVTGVAAALAQVQPLIMRDLVDRVAGLAATPRAVPEGMRFVAMSAVLLLAREVTATLLEFGQRQIGERLKVRLEAALSAQAVRHLLPLDAVRAPQPHDQRHRRDDHPDHQP